MANKKLITLMLVAAMAFSVVACSSDKTEETTAAEETTTEETAPTVQPYNKEANQEFEEPVMYDVVKEVTAYADLDATEVGATYTEGVCIAGVSTDGYYIMQDNGYIIEASCLEVLE